MNGLDEAINDGLRQAGSPARAPDRDACDAIFAAAARYNDPLLAWLKQELVLPAGACEAMEENLMSRIDAAGRGRTAYTWPIGALLAGLIPAKARAFAVVCAFLAAGITAGVAWRAGNGGGALVTRITQAYGSDFRSKLDGRLGSGVTLQSRGNGGISIVNSAGAVSLFNDASLFIRRATKRSVEYLAFSAAGSRSGRIDFHVTKRTADQSFVVVTRWYEIHVTGTTFAVERDEAGTCSTLLAEGTITIVSPRAGTMVLSAGQGFAADSSGNVHRIDSFRDTGKAAAASIISPSQAAAGCRLVVQSSPGGAQVFINGASRGITPFAMIGPEGLCTLSVRADRFKARDTVVSLGKKPVVMTLALDPSGTETPLHQGAADAAGGPAGAPLHEIARVPALSEPAADTPAQVRLLLDSAEHCETMRPGAALALYRTIANDQNSPPLYRQTALFSLGRLNADRLHDTANAAKSFGTYCILYPDGMFVSEALLRLAELEMKRNPSGAVEYFCRFLAVNPDNPRKADAAYHLGLLLQQQSDYREAIRMYKLALEQLGDTTEERGMEIKQMIATAQAAQQRPRTGNR